MLNWDPAQRCTVEQALSHPYLAAFHNPAAEPVAAAAFDFEDGLDQANARATLFRMACRFRPQLEGTMPKLEPKTKRSRQLSSELNRSTGCTAAVPPLSQAAAATADWPRYGQRGPPTAARVQQQPRAVQPGRVRQPG